MKMKSTYPLASAMLLILFFTIASCNNGAETSSQLSDSTTKQLPIPPI